MRVPEDAQRARQKESGARVVVPAFVSETWEGQRTGAHVRYVTGLYLIGVVLHDDVVSVSHAGAARAAEATATAGAIEVPAEVHAAQVAHAA